MEAMRYDAGHKEKTRSRLLRATAESIRARGVADTTIGTVTAAAGITHGGFYAHLRSRDELVAAGIREMFLRTGAFTPSPTQDSRETLSDYVDFYLSRAHRDRLSTTCPVPHLAADAERLAPAGRSNFAAGVGRLTAVIRRQLAHAGSEAADEEAHSVLAELV